MSLLTHEQYAELGAELADLPLGGEACPDCGDPSPGGAKCAACREWDSGQEVIGYDWTVKPYGLAALGVTHGSS